MGWVGLGWKRHGSEAEAGACVRMRMDATGGTLSASSASGQRVRAYARRYIDEPNVSCTRTPIDARMPNGRPAPARASTDKSTRAICSELFESTQVAHCASTAGTERRKGPLRMRPCRKHMAPPYSRCVALVGSAVRWSRTSAAWVAARSSDIWSRIPLRHCGSESITSTKPPRSWNGT